MVSELGDELGSVGFAVAAALIVVQLPVQVLFAVLQTLAGLNPGAGGVCGRPRTSWSSTRWWIRCGS